MAGSTRTKIILAGSVALALGATGVAAFSASQANATEITVYKSPT